MKLALLTPGGVDRTGVDRVVPALLWLLERLTRRHEVHVFAFTQEPDPGRWELLGAQVHNIGITGGRRRRLLAWFAEQHRNGPFDMVHAFWAGSGAYAALVGWRHRLPVMLHLAGGELVALTDIGYGGRCTLRGRLAGRIAMAGADRITVASASMQRLAAGLGVRSDLVPLGVALDAWPARPPRPRYASAPARLLHIGDLRPVKDQTTLLKAVAELRATGVALHLDLVGVDTLDGAIQSLADRLALVPVIQWHGMLRHEALRPLMDQADLLLVSSRHEAGPLVVLEAAVAGVPTVGTAVGHIADWSPHAAIAVPVGDSGALAGAIRSLLADEPRRLALAHAAQRLAILHDADATAAAFERMYRELIDARHAG